jgi:hypothetical protein
MLMKFYLNYAIINYKIQYMVAGNHELETLPNQTASSEQNQIWLPSLSTRMSRGRFLTITATTASLLLANLVYPPTALAQEPEDPTKAANDKTSPVIASQGGKWGTVVETNSLTSENEKWTKPADADANPNLYSHEFTPQGYVLTLHEHPGPKNVRSTSIGGFSGPRRISITSELLEAGDDSPQAIRLGSKVLRFGFNPFSGAYQVQEFDPETTQFIRTINQGSSEAVQRGNEPLMLTWQTEGPQYLGAISTIDGAEIARLTGQHPLATHNGNIWIGTSKQGNGNLSVAFRNLTVAR